MKFDVSKLISIGAIVIAGVAGCYGEISKQKERAEFEDLKSRVDTLESKEEES